jgi:phosphoserine phosphatase
MNAAAFFDVDGTLLPSPSLERRLVLSLIRRGELGGAQAARWLARILRFAARDWCAATSGNKAYLAGVSISVLEAWMAARYPLGVNFYPQGLDTVRRHAVLGDRIVFVSGTLAPLACAVAREVEDRLHLRAPILVCATELASAGEILTGEAVGAHLMREEKARVVGRLGTKYGWDLRASSAYGNSIADEGMLACVGHPFAVNPNSELTRRAQREGWPALHWDVGARARWYRCRYQDGELHSAIARATWVVSERQSPRVWRQP